ncbi:hypothetical protein HBI56_063210 [Parastagonospora nodorum]|nr:hypothetical protein HBH99_202100 [Parastagonospora nodorum]KAH4388755.1 hypothetical protein HBH97_052640 [Parastagonospora nodorum]KAH4924664.1 hypothetical protein HBI79_159760 [Parastagonospora nodorum]KAH5063047.1 hypothetical protein HBH96_060680 [Parastagonospora nodorum]KAH5429573.1 hypothetical protein HBI32_072580 [Parastagonospora nodorum]
MSFWDRPKKGSSIRKATNSTPPSTGDTPMHSPSPGREQSSRQSQLNHRNSRQPHEGAAIHPIERSTRRSPEYVQEARAATYGQAPASTYGAPEYSGSASRSQGYVPPSPLLQTSYNGPPSQANYRGNTQASTQPAYPGYASLLNDNIQPSPLSRDSYVGPPSQQNYQGNTQASTQAPSQHTINRIHSKIVRSWTPKTSDPKSRSKGTERLSRLERVYVRPVSVSLSFQNHPRKTMIQGQAEYASLMSVRIDHLYLSRTWCQHLRMPWPRSVLFNPWLAKGLRRRHTPWHRHRKSQRPTNRE